MMRKKITMPAHLMYDGPGLSGEGNKAQDFVCTLASKIRQLDERARGRAKKAPAMPFSWIYNREVQL
ncbi:unnamed protein product [Musa banksii]